VSAREKSKRKGSSDPPEEQLVRAWATANWRTYWRTRKRYFANRPFLTELQNRPPWVNRFRTLPAIDASEQAFPPLRHERSPLASARFRSLAVDERWTRGRPRKPYRPGDRQLVELGQAISAISF
jgi:hypothetical protein